MRFARMLRVGLIVLAMTGTARADPIVVTSGAVVLDFEGDFFVLRGSGFSINSRMPDFEFIPKTFANLCFPCRAGDIVDFSFTTNGEQFVGSGTATFGGTSYEQLFYRAELTMIAAAQRFPETTADLVDVVQPFVMTGRIRAFTDPQFSSLAFSTALRGWGRADTSFVRDEFTGVHFPEEGQLAYRFQPVPEPATLLLVGLGMAGVGLRRARQKCSAQSNRPDPKQQRH